MGPPLKHGEPATGQGPGDHGPASSALDEFDRDHPRRAGRLSPLQPLAERPAMARDRDERDAKRRTPGRSANFTVATALPLVLVLPMVPGTQRPATGSGCISTPPPVSRPGPWPSNLRGGARTEQHAALYRTRWSRWESRASSPGPPTRCSSALAILHADAKQPVVPITASTARRRRSIC